MTIMQLFILALATFRLTRLFVYDKIFEPVRAPFFNEVEEGEDIYLVPKGFIGELLSCHWCAGFWCSLFVTIWFRFAGIDTFITFLAVAGLASIIQWVIVRD